MNEKNGAIRDASVLGVPKMLILGLQHMFAMFGATILVPILVNSYFGGRQAQWLRWNSPSRRRRGCVSFQLLEERMFSSELS